MRRLPRLLLRLILGLVLLSVATLVVFAYITRSTPLLRDRVVTALNQRFDSQVQMKSLDVSAWPRPSIHGIDLELRQNGRTDVPPLITVHEFSGNAGLLGLFQSPVHLGAVTLSGLNIQIPAGGMGLSSNSPAAAAVTDAAPSPRRRRSPSLSIDRIEAASAWLELASKNPLKAPRVFDIHQMVMTNFRPDAPAQFHAKMTNAIPEGEIDTSGSFGPWIADRPRDTHIDGQYSLAQANLDDIKGLEGTLSSTGRYEGTLERIAVSGETKTPNFALDVARQPVPLNTTFSAIVDATNGDTYLEQVHATLADTLIQAKGAIVRARDIKGRHVTLDVAITEGRIEDVLKLAMKPGKAPLSGRIAINSSLVIPAGEQDVIDRMQLDGRFSLSQARFNSFNVQKRINVLSKRARGDEGDDEAQSVVSNVSGRFVLRNAVITFSALAFSVPGARVELAGAYGLRTEAMDFKGNLLLDSTLADMTSGWKSLAARVVQPFFRRPGGGSKLPIKVTGTRAKPSFGLDVRKAFLPG